MSTPRNPWVQRYGVRPSAAPRLRLFCFAYAGSSASVYRTWSAALPADVDVACVQLPGHETRIAEPAVTRLAELVPALAAGLEPELDRPYALFGHSVGALVAFELARELRRRGHPAAQHLFASAFRAPHRPNVNRSLHDLPTAALIRELRSYGGVPEAVFASQELLDLLLPGVRADFALHETYTYVEGPPLTCALTVLAGRADDKITVEQLDGWERQTTGPFRMVLFDDNHFFLNSQRERVQQTVARALAAPAG